MNDLDDTLRSLSGGRTSPGFTDPVLGRLDATLKRRTRRRRAMSVAAACTLVVGVLAGLQQRPTERPTAAPTVVVAGAVRGELDSIRAELAALRAAPPVEDEVLYLGQADGVDLVVNLANLGGNR